MTTRLRSSAVLDQYLSPLAVVGALVLLTELVVLRLITRTLIHIPGLESVGFAVRATSEFGRVAFGTAVVMATALLATTAVVQSRRDRPGIGSAIALFMTIAGLGAMHLVPESVVDVATVAAVLALPAMLAIRSRGAVDPRWLSVGLLAAAFTVASVPTIVGKLNPGLVLPVLGWSQFAETLAVGGAVAILAGRSRRLSHRSLGYGFAAAVVVLGALMAQPATVQTLMLWNFGLAGYLGPAVYAVAVGCVVYTAHASWTSGERTVAIGLAFVASGGIGLHSSLQSAAFILGIAILADPSLITPSSSVNELPSPVADDAQSHGHGSSPISQFPLLRVQDPKYDFTRSE